MKGLKHKKKHGNRLRFLAIVMVALMSLLSPVGTMEVAAKKTIQDVESDIKKTEQELDKINENIDEYSEEQELLEEQMDDLNSEIINMLASIGMLQDDITEKEKEIVQTQDAYEKAKKTEEEQHDAMVRRIQLNYEKGEMSSVMVLLDSESFGDFLNRLTYVTEVQRYDKKMLDQYEQTKIEVHDLWDRLEAEKADLEDQQAKLQTQMAYCEELMEELKQKSDNYDVMIANAKKQASEAKTQLQKEKKELNQLKEEERKRQEEEKRRKAEEERKRKEAEAAAAAAAAQAAAEAAAAQAAANGQPVEEVPAATTATTTVSSDASTIITSATGSEKGKEIAQYACLWVGNPYVAGGTSLTNGADCSGFTYRVYSDFGITIPRTSFEQRSAGVGVEYSQAQPGDLICYSGHVAMYIGDGKIVHASSKKTGIKISNANYKPILAVRRIVQ